MSPLVAAVVLLWVVVILLAFAMAGLLQQVRELEHNPPAAPAGGSGEVAGAVAAEAPGPDRGLSAVLLVEEGCGVCWDVLPRFAAAMETQPRRGQHPPQVPRGVHLVGAVPAQPLARSSPVRSGGSRARTRAVTARVSQVGGGLDAVGAADSAVSVLVKRLFEPSCGTGRKKSCALR